MDYSVPPNKTWQVKHLQLMTGCALTKIVIKFLVIRTLCGDISYTNISTFLISIVNFVTMERMKRLQWNIMKTRHMTFLQTLGLKTLDVVSLSHKKKKKKNKLKKHQESCGHKLKTHPCTVTDYKKAFRSVKQLRHHKKQTTQKVMRRLSGRSLSGTSVNSVPSNWEVSRP